VSVATATQFNLNHLDDLRTRHEIEAADGAQARIVHQHSHFHVGRTLDDARCSARLRKVLQYDTRLHPVRPLQLACERGQAIRAPGDEHHVELFGCEPSGERHADTGRRAGDEPPRPVGREHLHRVPSMFAGLSLGWSIGQPEPGKRTS
jgi:hypothetical protein